MTGRCVPWRCERRGNTFARRGAAVLSGRCEIVLKLDGTVVVNGQVFEKKEE